MSVVEILPSGQVVGGMIGQMGPQGVSIVSIEKTSTSGLVDTYTITFSNGRTQTYDVVNGNENVIESISVNNVAQTISNKNVDISVPTKTSDLTNDSGFIDNTVDNLTNYYNKTNTYTKTEIDNKIASVYKYKGSVATYQDLPSTDLTIGDVYNVETDGSNYAWNGTTWDKLGGDVDLSNYYNKTQTDELLGTKQDTIDSSHKLSSDLVDDTNKTNLFVSSSEKTTWNNKSDFSGNYNDLINKPTIPTKTSDLANDSDYTTKTYVDNLVGDIESILTTLDIGGGI